MCRWSIGKEVVCAWLQRCACRGLIAWSKPSFYIESVPYRQATLSGSRLHGRNTLSRSFDKPRGWDNAGFRYAIILLSLF
jgi:hypothetical protein